MSLSLLHHAPDGSGGWVITSAAGHPEVAEVMDTALRLQVVPHVVGAHSLPTRWHHCDGNAWAAVAALHRAGHHDTAMALAVLLRWCDQQFNGRSRGCWEIHRTDDLSEESR